MAYNKLFKCIKGWGLKINICDTHAWNAMAMHKQITFMFHIDDALMAHLCPQTATRYVKILDKEHVSNDKLTDAKGKVHEFLGALDSRVEGSCVLSNLIQIKVLP